MILEQTTEALSRLANNSVPYTKSRSLSPGLLGSIETDPPTDLGSDEDAEHQSTS